jgi:hypothetical protein
VLERRGEEAATPNLSVSGGGPILGYLQRGEYSPKMEIVGTSGSYSIKGPLGVISLCGPGEQISCGGYFGVYQNTYN